MVNTVRIVSVLLWSFMYVEFAAVVINFVAAKVLFCGCFRLSRDSVTCYIFYILCITASFSGGGIGISYKTIKHELSSQVEAQFGTRWAR